MQSRILLMKINRSPSRYIHIMESNFFRDTIVLTYLRFQSFAIYILIFSHRILLEFYLLNLIDISIILIGSGPADSHQPSFSMRMNFLQLRSDRQGKLILWSYHALFLLKYVGSSPRSFPFFIYLHVSTQ